MLSEKMQAALNEQINRELYSAYLYMAMSSWFDDQDLPGAANWTEMQAREELLHVQKFVKYVQERDGRVIYTAIDGPKNEWDNNVQAFEEVLAHEKFISASINDLVGLSMDERDFATLNFLQWFVAEQVEEEASAKDVLTRVKMVAAAPGGLYMLDRELSQRAAPAEAVDEGE